MEVDTVSDMVLGNFIFWRSLTPYFGKLSGAKRSSVLTKTDIIQFELWVRYGVKGYGVKSLSLTN